MTNLLRIGALGGLLSLVAKAALAATVYITAGTTWTVPPDFSVINTVEVIGHGGDGGPTAVNSAGGGGGAYAKISGIVLIPGAVVNIHLGTQICPTADGTWFYSSSTVYAESGTCGDSAGAGGKAANSIGTVKYSGGDSGAPAGGGAAGPNGAGGAAVINLGGTGDAGFGGAGGAIGGGNGGNGTEFGGGYGSGGGGGATNAAAGNAGTYGAGGAQSASSTTPKTSGSGALIVITYQPGRRVSSSVF